MSRKDIEEKDYFNDILHFADGSVKEIKLSYKRYSRCGVSLFYKCAHFMYFCPKSYTTHLFLVTSLIL